MKIGDLVKFVPDENSLVINDVIDQRHIGTILGFDAYRTPKGCEAPIIKVLWNTGSPGWILQSRVELIQHASR